MLLAEKFLFPIVWTVEGSGLLLCRKTVGLSITLILLVFVALLATTKLVDDSPSSAFFFGVEFAYTSNTGNMEDNLHNLKGLVDKVQDFTNLFVIGLPEISLNQTALNEACDYIYKAGLHFIVLFTNTSSYSFAPRVWTAEAQQKYGNSFLGVYRIDEPGGKELDNYAGRFLDPSSFDPEVKNYTGASQKYNEYLNVHLGYLHENLYPTIFTADYGLYWFDYKAGFNTVFAEFGWNNSRQMNIALCRGAARAQNRDWGVMITWTYREWPYLQLGLGSQFYDDMVLAYNGGAKYVVIFDYPSADSSEYGILYDVHFEAMRNFWNYVNSNPQNHGADQVRVAYVLPQDYGFGLRSSSDHIWGIWAADDLSSKVWDDVNKLVARYGSRFDVVYNDPEYVDAIKNRYPELIYWNDPVT